MYMLFMVMHSMVQGLNVMMRIGAEDRTIHPYFNRRMYRILSEWKINVTYVEVKDKEHWWWDSMYVDHYMHSNYRCIGCNQLLQLCIFYYDVCYIV